MKSILAYTNSVRPAKGEEGQLFINLTTGQTYEFKDGKWQPVDSAIPVKTPSTPEKVLSEPQVPQEAEVLHTEKEEESTIINTDEPPVTEDIPAVVEEAPKPKKKSTSKKTTKKETSK